ncbi:hypothetical protein JG687_00011950, partial [Phytophthora cactorum]
STTVSLSQACSFGSTKLLDWIWDSSCTSVSNRPSTWLLHNYLRSDLHYNGDQFFKSLEIAVRRKDLTIVKWLFAHFSGYDVLADLTTLAACVNGLPFYRFSWITILAVKEEIAQARRRDSGGK